MKKVTQLIVCIALVFTSCKSDNDLNQMIEDISDTSIKSVERLKAYPDVNFSNYMVCSFKVTYTNGYVFYWAGLFEGGGQEPALQQGEKHIAKATKPTYKWGFDRNWNIFAEVSEIKPKEIYRRQKKVLIN